MGFHHTDDADENDEKMLERVAKYFVSEKQFWTDADENEIDFIEAYLYYDKDCEIYLSNKILQYEIKLKKKNILEYERLNKEIANNIKVKYIPI